MSPSTHTQHKNSYNKHCRNINTYMLWVWGGVLFFMISKITKNNEENVQLPLPRFVNVFLFFFFVVLSA